MRHDNVVGYKDLFQGKDHIYIILELVSGGELFDLITTGDRVCIVLIQFLILVDNGRPGKVYVQADAECDRAFA